MLLVEGLPTRSQTTLGGGSCMEATSFERPLAIPASGVRVSRRWVLARDMHGRPLRWSRTERLPLDIAVDPAMGHAGACTGARRRAGGINEAGSDRIRWLRGLTGFAQLLDATNQPNLDRLGEILTAIADQVGSPVPNRFFSLIIAGHASGKTGPS